MERIDRVDMLREVTKLVSRRGTCLRAQVGCVIARHGRIIVTGYNGSPPGEPHCLDVGCEMQDGHCVRTIHAEANAIAFAARYGISVEGCTLYTYGWAGGICHRCKKLCLSAGIKEFVEIPLEFGGPSDLWGKTWTPEEINKAGFGFSIPTDAKVTALEVQRFGPSRLEKVWHKLCMYFNLYSK